jgi:hypothetical protein
VGHLAYDPEVFRRTVKLAKFRQGHATERMVRIYQEIEDRFQKGVNCKRMINFWIVNVGCFFGLYFSF